MFSRLLWKESRELAALWVGLLAIGVLVLVLAMRMGLSPHMHGQAALVLAGCFGLAAAARQFAGEEEDGTIGWLRMLPCDGRSVWWAKLLTAHAGAALLWLPLAILAVATAGRLPPTWTFVSYSPYALPTFLVTAPAIATAVALWSRGVLATVLGTGALSLALAWVSGFLPDWMLNGPYQVLVVAIALGVGWREFGGWWRGTMLDVIESPAVRASSRPVEASRINPVVAPLARWSERTATRRIWRSLLWQEGRRAATFVAWWLLIVPATMLLVKWAAAELRPAVWLIPTTPILAGLWSLRGDQRAAAYTFLGDRGVSAVAVWLSRQVVWLPMAILLALAAIWLDSQATAWFNNRNLTNVSITTWWDMWTHAGYAGGGRTPVDAERILIEQVILSLSLYAAGHLAGLIFPQVVLAIIAGVLSGMVVVGWQWWRFSDFYTPVAWGLLLPLAGLALAAALVGPWLERRPLVLRKCVTAGLLAVAMIVLGYGVTLSGLWNFPAVSERTMPSELREARKRLLTPNTQATAELLAASRYLSTAGRGRPERWDDELVATVEKWLAGKQSPQFDYWLIDGDRGIDGLGILSPEVTGLTDYAARSAGPRSASKFLLAVRRLLRLTRDNSIARNNAWFEYQVIRNLAESWMTWARRDDVTAEDLARTIAELEAEFRLGMSIESQQASRIAAMRLMVDRPAEHRKIVDGIIRLFGIVPELRPSLLVGWRLDRALTAMFVDTRMIDSSLDRTLVDPNQSFLGGTDERYGMNPGLDAERAFQQMRIEFELSRHSYWLGYTSMVQYQQMPWLRRNHANVRNTERMLLVALTLEHQRKQTGKLPESLLGLQMPATSGVEQRPVPVDLFGGSFGYLPQGFDTPVLVERTVHAAGQPLLWSPGLRQKRWQDVPDGAGLKLLNPEPGYHNRPQIVPEELRHLPTSDSVLPVFEIEP